MSGRLADTVRPAWQSRWSWLCLCGYENWRWDKRCAGWRAHGCPGMRPARHDGVSDPEPALIAEEVRVCIPRHIVVAMIQMARDPRLSAESVVRELDG